MQKKSIGLTILLWAEVIVSARILLFTVPVLVQKLLAQTVAPQDITDWFILVITFAAFIYFLAGLLAIVGNAWWKMMHYGAAGLVVFLSAGLLNMVKEMQVAMEPLYFYPLAAAILLTVLVSVLKDKVQHA